MNMKKCTVKSSLFRENIPVETYESISKSYEKHCVPMTWDPVIFVFPPAVICTASPRKGSGCHSLAFVTALDRCGLAGEKTAFLVFQAVVVRGFIVTIFR